MELENIIKNIFLQHVGRKNAITIKQLCKSPLLKGASEKMIRTGIYNLRKQQYSICSLPGPVGYFYDNNEDHSEMKTSLNWIRNWRLSMKIKPSTPQSLSWV